MKKNKILSLAVAGTMAAALVSVSSARPVAAAKPGVMMQAERNTAQPEWLGGAVVSGLAGAAGGAARGAVVALFGTPVITAAVVTGAVSGAAAGVVAYGVVSFFGRWNDAPTFDTSSLKLALDH